MASSLSIAKPNQNPSLAVEFASFMASSHPLILLLVLFSISVTPLMLVDAQSAANTSLVSAGVREACKTTPDPSFCKSALPNNGTGDVHYYGRYTVMKSLSQAQKFLSLVNKYLARGSSLTPSAVGALQDCQLLASLNLDFLLDSLQALNNNATTLPTQKADDVQTLLSAILTNQQSCLDGLQSTASAWSVKSGLSQPLANNTKLFTVSLALFTNAWVPSKKTKQTKQPRSGPVANGKLSLSMSSSTQAVLELVNKRKLIEQSTGAGTVQVSDMVVVSQDGTGNFTTIGDAVSAAPNNTDGSNGYFLIYVKAGIYQEYVSIAKNKKYLMMMGDGINQTIITGNRSVVDGWTTFNSATFAVVASNFLGTNFTVQNTAGPEKHQAVALRNGGDLSTFYSCSFEGYQDTLYAHSLRQFYRACQIYGTVDFIFGNAAAVFQDCEIYPRLPMSGQFNAITAQGRTDVNQNTGISIHNCTITAAPDLAAAVNATVETYLGRPWKNYSRTVYMQSFMDDLINPAGWTEWDGNFALSTLYYAEYENSGPGSNTTDRVTWPGYRVINATEAANFTVSSFLLGEDWLPKTGVPYTSSLV